MRRAAHESLTVALSALRAATGPTATPDELVGVLAVAEETRRALDRIMVDVTADLQRRGTFADRGYRSAAGALSDLLGWERFESRRRVVAADSVCPTVGLGGEELPARMPATATVFADGTASLRHVETIARVLSSGPATRLTPEQWAGAEIQLAGQTGAMTPTELHTWGMQLVELLDQDGAEPSDEPVQLNELRLSRFRTRPGGKITGRYDDAALFAAIAAVIDAGAAPRDPDDERPVPQRQAEALAEACAQVLDRGRLPETGGRRPQLVVTVRLEDLERRAAAASLEFGGALSAATLRQLACDAAVVPMVLSSTGVPLDVGRISRTVPDGLRRAVTARDGGCAWAGCDRPPSWCEVHHVVEWANGGPTELGNLVMLCSAHHRLIHHSLWEVRMVNGLPEFIPPSWIDRSRRPRRRPTPAPVG
ncbi:HNH endonuclease [Pseudonocardia sp. RS11V-5]|uniref:HNH endonuclease signature motif containing protein n=1 Tax=Pseudonocardia terrae TaxID=2905831 RepID=UPI001E37A36D|nr:HNH endonuclease signature motif containing protein [Pseudonocardia terrae]MCE3552987.1 HNH endonuclease [Pseudonocardia terrae]